MIHPSKAYMSNVFQIPRTRITCAVVRLKQPSKQRISLPFDRVGAYSIVDDNVYCTDEKGPRCKELQTIADVSHKRKAEIELPKDARIVGPIIYSSLNQYFLNFGFVRQPSGFYAHSNSICHLSKASNEGTYHAIRGIRARCYAESLILALGTDSWFDIVTTPVQLPAWIGYKVKMTGLEQSRGLWNLEKATEEEARVSRGSEEQETSPHQVVVVANSENLSRRELYKTSLLPFSQFRTGGVKSEADFLENMLAKIKATDELCLPLTSHGPVLSLKRKKFVE